MDDAVKPIKSTVDHIALKGKQSAKTVITKTQQKVSPVISNLKQGKESMIPGFKTTKSHDTLENASKSKFATKLEQAKQLGKAHLEQLKFAVAHPIITTVTSKARQKSIRGSAKFIDEALRPVGVRTVQTTMGDKVFAGFERGESTGKLTGKADHFIAIKQAEKDAIKGTTEVSDVKTIVEKGKQFINGRRNKLKPNIRYKTGEYDYYYETDNLGRIEKFETDNLQLTEREERLSHSKNTPGKVKGQDHAGHLEADRFGGSPKIDNLVSQLSDVNLKQYKKIENEWASALKETPPKEVTVNVEIVYAGKDMRPAKFIVNYTIDGEWGFKVLKN